MPFCVDDSRALLVGRDCVRGYVFGNGRPGMGVIGTGVAILKMEKERLGVGKAVISWRGDGFRGTRSCCAESGKVVS